MAEHLSNRVFRAVEGRGAGLLPLLPAELVAVLGVVAGGAAALHLFVGVGAGLVLAGGLVAWRRKDRGRSDYVQAALRAARVPEGVYAVHGRDRRAVPFAARSER